MYPGNVTQVTNGVIDVSKAFLVFTILLESIEVSVIVTVFSYIYRLKGVWKTWIVDLLVHLIFEVL